MMILESQLPLQIKKCHVHIKNDVSCTWELLDMLIFNYLFLMFGSSYILVIYIFVFFYFSSLFHVFYFYCYWHFNFIWFAILETSLISMFGCYINGYLILCIHFGYYFSTGWCVQFDPRCIPQRFAPTSSLGLRMLFKLGLEGH